MTFHAFRHENAATRGGASIAKVEKAPLLTGAESRTQTQV